MNILSTNTLNYAYGKPACSGQIRTVPEDFIVDEISGFEPSGEGEHILLQVQKRNTNTDWLAKKLSQFVGVKQMDVSYAGLKDRNAVTTQWFSVRLAGKEEPDWTDLNCDEYKVLQSHRHNRKLRRGSLKGNRFEIIVRNIEGDISGLENRLQKIKQFGVPNYFGEQRFGTDGANLEQALAMFKGKRIKNRNQRSIYLSAARSYIFNLYLSERVKQHNWNKAVAGDVMILDGSNSHFPAETVTDEIVRRVEEFDIHPSGILWGRGAEFSGIGAELIDSDTIQLFCNGLEKAGLDQARRPLRLTPRNLNWHFDINNNMLKLDFELTAGSYATSVLREVLQCL